MRERHAIHQASCQIRLHQIPTLRDAWRSRLAGDGAKSAWLRVGLVVGIAIGTKPPEPLLHILDGLLRAGQLAVRRNVMNA